MNSVSRGHSISNKVFTNGKYEQIAERIRKKIDTQVRTGVDSELLQAGAKQAFYYFETGARSFADYTEAMVDALGEGIRPYLRMYYEGARYYPGFDNTGMTPHSEIEASQSKDEAPQAFDPELALDGLTLAGYYIEGGARSFTDYTQAMVENLGESICPFLRSWYENIRYTPGFDTAGMTPTSEIDESSGRSCAMQDDPWNEMAIEKQYAALVENNEWGWPKTLAYLQEIRPQVVESMRGVLDYEVDQLVDALLGRTYAKELTRKVWGEEAEFSTHREETLDYPEELANLVIASSAISK